MTNKLNQKPQLNKHDVSGSISVSSVKNAIYQFGFYPALHILKELEDNEEFEKCKIFKEALDQVGAGREWYLSSKTEEKEINKTYNNILKNCDKPKLIHNNMEYYISEFKRLVF
jgi:hypothetical protein